jgi:hypothetical protein
MGSNDGPEFDRSTLGDLRRTHRTGPDRAARLEPAIVSAGMLKGAVNVDFGAVSLPSPETLGSSGFRQDAPDASLKGEALKAGSCRVIG